MRNVLRIIRSNKVQYSIWLFIIVFVAIYYYKPSAIFNSDGLVRPFGFGYKNKTIVPIWLVSIILAIFSYLFILYITGHYKLQIIY